jgi:hypothetical protein
MKILTLIFFYGYVWALIVFGGLCVFTAKFDQQILYKLNTDQLEPRTGVSLLSQYRFFRAIECGFGVFAFTCRKAIFEKRFFNRLFLGTMLGGVVARSVSLVLDGQPYPVFYAFLLSELIGVILIFIYTRTTLKNDERP